MKRLVKNIYYVAFLKLRGFEGTPMMQDGTVVWEYDANVVAYLYKEFNKSEIAPFVGELVSVRSMIHDMRDK